MTDRWRATDIATLVFCVRGDEVLLIEKQRGLGAGKVNGPGGKLEPRESVAQCAVREVEEETGVCIETLSSRGELRFRFADGYRLQVHVFVATEFSGVPRITEEAIPFWCGRDDIPYDRMWADDRLWLDAVLDGASVDGELDFDGDVLGKYHLTLVPGLTADCR